MVDERDERDADESAEAGVERDPSHDVHAGQLVLNRVENRVGLVIRRQGIYADLVYLMDRDIEMEGMYSGKTNQTMVRLKSQRAMNVAIDDLEILE